MAVQTFVLKIPEAAIADLKNRLSIEHLDALPGRSPSGPVANDGAF
jgi:hypothetical protein